MLALQGALGLRWGELLGVRVSDVTLGHKKLWVRRTIIETAKADSGNGTPFEGGVHRPEGVAARITEE